MLKLAMVFLFALGVGCGPEQTAQQREDQARAAVISEKVSKLKVFEGKYRGTFTDVNGKKAAAVLQLLQYTVFIPNPGTNTVNSIPVLMGAITYMNGPDRMTLASFDTGDYDETTNQIKLVGNNARTGGSKSILILNVNPDSLDGFFQNWGPMYVETEVHFQKD